MSRTTARALLREITSISPVTPPGDDHFGHCHYCGEPARADGTVTHEPRCYWLRARTFADHGTLTPDLDPGPSGPPATAEEMLAQFGPDPF